MEKERKAALEWFVSFANSEINELDEGDKAKLLVGAKKYLFPKKRGSFPLAKNFPQPSKNQKELWRTIFKAHDLIRKALDFFLKPNEAMALPDQGMILFAWDEKFLINTIPISKSHESYLTLQLFLLFDNLPHSALQKCRGCRNLFINTSLRQKKFCSPQCMWRFNAQNKRRELKKNPSEYKRYLEKQREIMRRKYVEKRKLELGANVKVNKAKDIIDSKENTQKNGG